MGVKKRALDSMHVAWTEKVREMGKMDQASTVQPRNPQAVFHVREEVSGDTVKVDCGPAVFKLCERANGIPKMYVVVEGSICVQESGLGSSELHTIGFGTRVGYFREARNRLEHVYGVHYDMDERGDGHPVFHAQFGPAKGFAAAVRKYYSLSEEEPEEDYVGRILRNVRTPTAQMDFFSVVTQLCADHLMSVSGGEQNADVVEAFNRVRSACKFLLGAAHRLPYLSEGNGSECYRSSRWYGPA